MSALESISFSPVPESFVEMHIEDLVKDRVFWRIQLNGQSLLEHNLPSVIHPTLEAVKRH